MLPPINSTRLLAIGIPRPVPETGLTVLCTSRLNGSKRFLRYSSPIPCPLSLIRNWYCAKFPFFFGTSVISNTILPPFGVYFTALDKMFSSICFRRNLSASTSSVSIRCTWIMNSCPFSLVCERIIISSSSTSSAIFVFVILRTVLPASIFDISRTSLMSPSRCSPE